MTDGRTIHRAAAAPAVVLSKAQMKTSAHITWMEQISQYLYDTEIPSYTGHEWPNKPPWCVRPRPDMALEENVTWKEWSCWMDEGRHSVSLTQ